MTTSGPRVGGRTPRTERCNGLGLGAPGVSWSSWQGSFRVQRGALKHWPALEGQGLEGQLRAPVRSVRSGRVLEGRGQGQRRGRG